ncbi:MAG: hypothetical protein HWE23_09725 [Rhodobacteraceae bacterium]|nr:hypothetical protein [Paracoccaceae bacterium]
MIRKTVLICAGIVLLLLKAEAQYIAEEDTTERVIPKLSVKYFPSHLLGHFPSNVIGAEYLFNSNIALEARYGWIKDELVYDYDETYYRNKSGFKSSVVLKRYFKDYELKDGLFPFLFNFNRKNETFVPYLATELFYNNIQYDRERTYKFDCGDGCDYYSEIEYGLERKVYGARLQIGFISQIFKPIFLEGSFAFGLMVYDLIADERKPVEFERQYGYLFDENDLHTILPTLDLNLKLVFRILQ